MSEMVKIFLGGERWNILFHGSQLNGKFNFSRPEIKVFSL